ncbi:MAG TPA: hypothetical protein VF771_01255, partial [Longimicrobiaceae bacterium]
GLSDDDAPQWEPLVVAARAFGPVQVHASARAELHDVAGSLTGGLGAMLDMDRLTPTVELSWSSGDDDYVVPGIFVHPRHDVDVGVGLPICLQCANEPRQVRVMLTAEL